ncbi:MAG: hypothetical protein EXS51_01805 [Candidatus Taylorbacteria bacterium]|nr:hypothetical protein [Candidatus Taylorbacteria bacterium]
MKGNRGFIKTILLIVIALIVLGFFGYNLKEIVASPTVHDNLVYVWDIVAKLWNTLIATPALWMWNTLSGFLPKS